MRRKAPAAVAFVFLLPMVAHAQEWTVEQREVIEQLKTCWDIWEDALQAGDPDPWLEMCADPAFTYWADEAVPAGIEMTRRAWGTWMESDYRWVDLRPLVVTIHDDIAIMQFYGYWNEKRPNGRAIVEGKRMEVFRKVNGRWLLLAGHATAPPETPVSASVEAEPNPARRAGAASDAANRGNPASYDQPRFRSGTDRQPSRAGTDPQLAARGTPGHGIGSGI